ncbi:MAG TPA: HEAT repeat domain-containing protein [Tepidisphaeraceae bacterium]
MSLRLRAAVLGLPLFVGALALPPAAVAQDAAADPINKVVEDFWHYGKVARYDVAAAKAAEVVAAAGEPVKVLEAFERVARDRGDDLDTWLIRWQGVEQLKEPAAQIAKIVNDGRYSRREAPGFIETNIARLDKGMRPYDLALVQLRQSGELAVPPLLDAIRDPAKTSLHGPARRAILDLGRAALNPLVAATESDNTALVGIVVNLLGELGYDAAVPYLARLAESDKATSEVKQAATAAMQRLGGNGKSGDLFYAQAEKQYYGKSSLVSDNRFPTANVWKWEGNDKGLVRTPIPPAIFNDLMAMRQSEYALAQGTESDALSLWLAANYKREADLPQGEKDATRAADQPAAHYYGVTAGARFLNAALARALRDGNSAVALSATKSLQEIVGDANFRSGDTSPLIDAMQYADRRVRFEAAFTLARALPQSAFTGQELVVPLLAEAISQSGRPSVLAIFPSQDAVNGIVEPLKADNYVTAGATNTSGALSAAAALPAVDVVVISTDLPAADVESLLGLLQQSPKTRGAAKLFVVKTTASDWEKRKATDRTFATTTATDAAGLKAAITSARETAGGLPLDAELATQYATRAGELIKQIAISRGQVLDLAPAQSTLLGALEDPRPEIVKLAGEGLGLMKTADAQKGLALKANTEGVADDVKVSLFKSLATSAKFFGNQLDEQQTSALENSVKSATNADVKAAAAEARGALNLPSEQAKALILDQSKR